mmetsp:Transcript_34271/g.79060  ORF Transcript_34271/g.79060 Transcript_34271/m.79060 type:complete len:227 (-) Transcript_34271:222-902(-)
MSMSGCHDMPIQLFQLFQGMLLLHPVIAVHGKRRQCVGTGRVTQGISREQDSLLSKMHTNRTRRMSRSMIQDGLVFLDLIGRKNISIQIKGLQLSILLCSSGGQENFDFFQCFVSNPIMRTQITTVKNTLEVWKSFLPLTMSSRVIDVGQYKVIGSIGSRQRCDGFDGTLAVTGCIHENPLFLFILFLHGGQVRYGSKAGFLMMSNIPYIVGQETWKRTSIVFVMT